jgi:ATP-dependent Clp protease ATP-binding subunit ClpC
MFERYTESARRVLFFARYEVSQVGASEIRNEHLLLGLVREPRGLVPRIVAQCHVALESIRRDLEARVEKREKIATSIEIPFSAETVEALQFAAEEADRLLHKDIGPEHLLLGLLRAEGSLAASVLISLGLRIQDVRIMLTTLLAESPMTSEQPGARVFEEIEEIKRLVEQLAAMPAGDTAQGLAHRIRDSLDALKLYLR